MMTVAYGRQPSLMSNRGTNESSTTMRSVFVVLPMLIFFGAVLSDKMSGQQFVDVADEYNISAQPHSINFGSGMSFYDFDNDGWDDLSFTMTNDSLRFYRNNGAGFDLMPSIAYGDGETKHLLWVDYDNDGDLDLAVSINNGNYKLYQNNGSWNFQDVSEQAGLSTADERHYGMSFCDYDKDGFLDFYVCVYALDEGPDIYETYNHLYHNNGDGTFTDVTLDAGVQDGIKLSFQSIWFDYDNDGWVDLFVINDRLYANSMYRNNGDGTFTNMAESAGVAYPGQDPMTATLGDFDNDGDLDVYLTNTGVTGKKPKLLVNNSDGTFTNKADEYGVVVDVWTWGGLWVDTENDGWQDLYVCTDDPNVTIFPVDNSYFSNTGEGPLNTAQEVFSGSHNARSHSVARGDFNNDGCYDIAVLNKFPYEPFLWENQGNNNNYLKFTLQGTVSNSFAISSLVKVYAGGSTYTQWTMCGENYLGQNSQHHIVGVGEANVIDSVYVTYSLGHTDKYYSLPVNSSYQFVEGETFAVSLHPTGQVDLCQGESVTLSAEGYEVYAWNNGHDGNSITTDTSGVYILSVSNEFGITASDTVEVNLHPLPDCSISITEPLCHGAADGSVTIENQTGVPFESVSWSNGEFGESLFGLPAGYLSFECEDAHACTASGDVEISEPEPIEVELSSEPATESSGGGVEIIASGGTEPLQIFIDGVLAPEGTAGLLSAGWHDYLIVDANGCDLSGSFEIELITSVSDFYRPMLTLYPNPSSGKTSILGLVSGSPVEMTLYDILGKVIWESSFTATNPYTLPFVPSTGIHLIRVQQDGNDALIRWMVSSD